MKTTLHRTLLVGAIAFIGLQSTNAQDYLGTPFGGVATKIGTAVGTADKLELENFDSIGTFADGFNIGGNMSASAFGTYWDKSTAAGGGVGNNAGNDEAGTYRPAGEVDIAGVTYEDGTTGHVLTGNQGGEYTLQTIEVVTAGTYHLNLHFKSFGSGKKYQVFLYAKNNLAAPNKVLFNASSADAPDGTLVSTKVDDGDPSTEDYIYRDSQDSKPFELTTGEWIVQARTLDGGPTFDYIAFTLDEEATASIDEDQLLGSKLSAYPNPSDGGLFTLSLDSKWEVYNVLGVKMVAGEGTSVDLSRFSKGVYMLKTAYTTKTLITK